MSQVGLTNGAETALDERTVALAIEARVLMKERGVEAVAEEAIAGLTRHSEPEPLAEAGAIAAHARVSVGGVPIAGGDQSRDEDEPALLLVSCVEKLAGRAQAQPMLSGMNDGVEPARHKRVRGADVRAQELVVRPGSGSGLAGLGLPLRSWRIGQRRRLSRGAQARSQQRSSAEDARLALGKQAAS